MRNLLSGLPRLALFECDFIESSKRDERNERNDTERSPVEAGSLPFEFNMPIRQMESIVSLHYRPKSKHALCETNPATSNIHGQQK